MESALRYCTQGDAMNAIELFLEFHEGKGLPADAIDRLFDQMSKAQLRCRPYPVLNSVAWIIWHMARAEDTGVNRFVIDCPQVFDEGNWGERMKITIRHHGGGMADAEVTALSQQIDLPALRSYYTAVRARTVEVVKMLTPDQLAEIPDSTKRRRIIDAEGIFPPPLSPDELPYQGWSRGSLLLHLAMTHNYGHFYEVCTVCSLMGISFWQ
jgi:hypothetical protein